MIINPYRYFSEFVLDQYPGTNRSFSLRRLSSTYTGPALRVRRDSDDAEMDIRFLPTTELLDETQLTNFVGGGTGYVVIWYDQSGTSRDLTQPTNSLQPIIVDAGVIVRGTNNLPAINKTITSWMQFTQHTAANITLFSIIQPSTVPSPNNNAFISNKQGGATLPGVDWFLVDFSTGVPSWDFAAINTSNTNWIDGIITNGYTFDFVHQYSSIVEGTIGDIELPRLGSNDNESNKGIFLVQEIVAFNTAQPSIREGFEENQKEYWMTPEPYSALTLDVFPNAKFAVSLSRLTVAHTGPLIRVQRQSDNAQMDIGYLPNGDLDVSALLTFANASGISSARVITWYDQSGNGNDGTIDTIASSPIIVDALGDLVVNDVGKPAATADPIEQYSANLLPDGTYPIGDALRSFFITTQPISTNDNNERNGISVTGGGTGSKASVEITAIGEIRIRYGGGSRGNLHINGDDTSAPCVFSAHSVTDQTADLRFFYKKTEFSTSLLAGSNRTINTVSTGHILETTRQKFSEIIIYEPDKVSQVDEITDYIMNKWNISE